MRGRVKIVLWSGSAVLVIILFCAFGLPPILRNVLEQQLQKNLHRPSTVEAVSFNPFTLCLTVRGLTIREPDDSAVFFSFESLLVNAEISSAIERGMVLGEVTLTKPRARIVRAEENLYNFSDILASDDKEPKNQDGPPAKPFLFSIANIRLIDGSVEFDDQPRKIVHQLTDIELGLPLISNFKRQVDVFVQPSLSATINGRTFNLNGQTKPFANSLETAFELNIADLDLAQYLPYVPQKLNFTMPSGRLSARLKLLYLHDNDNIDAISVKGSLSLADLTLVSLDNSPLAGIPSLAIAGIACTINKRELVIDDISIKGLSLALVREKGGTVLLKQLFADKDAAGAEEPAEPKADADPDAAWLVLVKKLTSTAAAITFDDLLPQQPARFSVDNFDVTLANVATTADTPADIDLACRINNEGTLGLKGTFALASLSANLDVDLRGLDIRFAQNYFPDSLLVTLNSGTLGLRGGLDFKTNDDTPSVMWQGDIRLTGFSAKKKGAREDLLKLSSLELKSMRAGNAPLAIAVKTVNLAGLFLNTVVEADGTFNLASLNNATKEPQNEPGPGPAPDTQETSPRVNIDSIVFEKGRIKFTDKTIKPRYTTELAGITGRITGISNSPDAQADIRLNAKLNRYAPFAVTGTIQPLQEKLSADILVKFDNIDLSPFSPYSGKFIGRTLKKGTLSLDLNYAIQNNRLTSQNKFFIDQMTLGKKVDSKDATSLPVGLAISLLKNRKGEIALDLPASGSLDDPSFRVSKVILKTLVNLLEKAATSPFALVGAMIPGGADISSIAFPCGTARLDAEAVKKLNALAGLLAEKPDLRLEIQPVGNMESDAEGLRREMVLFKLQQLTFKDMSKHEREGLTPEEVVIPDDEYEDYLWQAYKAEKFEKPEGLLGLTRRLPADEMEQLMVANTQVDDDDVKELVDRRGLAVRQYLSETAGVPAERLFIVDSRVDSGNGSSGCAVAFNLK